MLKNKHFKKLKKSQQLATKKSCYGNSFIQNVENKKSQQLAANKKVIIGSVQCPTNKKKVNSLMQKETMVIAVFQCRKIRQIQQLDATQRYVQSFTPMKRCKAKLW